jgi:hypothetical protein
MGCRGISAWGGEHIDDLPELIDRAVDIAPPASDLHIRLVHRPAISHSVSTRAGSLGQQRHEPKHPSIHRDVVDLDATLGGELFDVAVRQPEA